VPLKSGGHLIIEQTEAMITIDVNTGGSSGATTWKTPCSAPIWKPPR
jgi:Ribonuclease G/E